MNWVIRQYKKYMMGYKANKHNWFRLTGDDK